MKDTDISKHVKKQNQVPFGHVFRVIASPDHPSAHRQWGSSSVNFRLGPAPYEGAQEHIQYLNLYDKPQQFAQVIDLEQFREAVEYMAERETGEACTKYTRGLLDLIDSQNLVTIMKQRLKRAIRAHVNAQIERSWIGNTDKADHEAINANAEECQKKLNVLVDEIEKLINAKSVNQE